jgi:hypothetical protein
MFTIGFRRTTSSDSTPGFGQVVVASYTSHRPAPSGEYESSAAETVAGNLAAGYATAVIVEAPPVIERRRPYGPLRGDRLTTRHYSALGAHDCLSGRIASRTQNDDIERRPPASDDRARTAWRCASSSARPRRVKLESQGLLVR